MAKKRISILGFPPEELASSFMFTETWQAIAMQMSCFAIPIFPSSNSPRDLS